jgi:drug/metabolite transporter (DMT)-like permease
MTIRLRLTLWYTALLGATLILFSFIFYSALAPAVLMAPVVPLAGSMPPSAWHALLLLLLLGVFGAVGHWFLIKAYRLASTTALAPYPYLQMVWMTASSASSVIRSAWFRHSIS